jgi:sugar phosphate isomerase/epimerase
MTELVVGVCGWCIDRHDVRRSIEVAQELGFPAIQVGFFSRAATLTFAQAPASSMPSTGSKLPVAPKAPATRPVGAFVAFEGEDYSSIARIAETGGLMPDDPYQERLAAMADVVEVAARNGCPSVALHAGTISPDRTSRGFTKLAERVRSACDVCTGRGVRLLLETGRESAETLLAFIAAVDRPNLGVNFDTGNFTVYGTDDPVAAVTKLKGRIELVHVKDAFASASPGREYGTPAPLGQGDVNVARVLSKLRATGYRGPLLLEVDTRATGVETLRNATAYLRTMLA